DLGHRLRDLELEDAGALDQALGVLGELEDLAAVGALALEHRAAVVERVAQNMDIRLAPRNELAVHPDETVAIVVGNDLSHDDVLFGSVSRVLRAPARLQPRRPFTPPHR